MASFLTIFVKLQAKDHMVLLLFCLFLCEHITLIIFFFIPFSVIDIFFLFIQKKMASSDFLLGCHVQDVHIHQHSCSIHTYRGTRPCTDYLKYIQLYHFNIIFKNWFKKRLEIINWFATFEYVTNNVFMQFKRKVQ